MVHTALISGGTSGIGLMAASHLLSKGWNVIIFSRNEASIATAKNALAQHDNALTILRCDIASDHDVAALVKTLRERNIHLDAVINCAAILGPVGLFHENDFQKWKQAIDIDLTGNARLLHAIIPLLLESVPARIAAGTSLPKVVNVGGGGAGNARIYHTAYGTAKTAMVRLTEGLAVEYKDKIEFNIIAPGAHKTNIWKDETYDKEPAKWADVNKLYALIDYLTGRDSDGITGRFVHIENDYRSFTPEISSTERYLLRRTN